jgi:hypothetical protein
VCVCGLYLLPWTLKLVLGNYNFEVILNIQPKANTAHKHLNTTMLGTHSRHLINTAFKLEALCHFTKGVTEVCESSSSVS